MEVVFKKAGRSIVPVDDKNKERLTAFLDKIEDGKTINAYFEVNGEKYSVIQLNKIHKMIRVLASDLGYSFEEMKKIVKQKSGLYVAGEYKSFASCDKETLCSVIQTLQELYDFNGLIYD